MKYSKTISAKNGKEILLRSATAADAEAVLENFLLTHAETDYLLSYPDESSFSKEQERLFLGRKEESPKEVGLIAWVDGRVAATAGVDAIGRQKKGESRKWRPARSICSFYWISYPIWMKSAIGL